MPSGHIVATAVDGGAVVACGGTEVDPEAAVRLNCRDVVVSAYDGGATEIPLVASMLEGHGWR